MQSTDTATNRSFGEAGAMVAICFGWFILASISSVASGFSSSSSPVSDSAFLSLILSEIVFAAIALIFLRLRRYPLRWLLPSPTGWGCIVGIILYVVVTFLAWPASLISGHPADSSQPIVEMLRGATYSLPMVALVSVINGYYEETFLTGYLLQGLSHLGQALSIGVVGLVRLMYHLYQGPVGAIGALVFGLVIGLYYWRTRDLWSVISAHVVGDFVGLGMA